MKTVHSKLSKEARERRKLFPPLVLLAGALHDDIGKLPTKARAVKAKRSRGS